MSYWDLAGKGVPVHTTIDLEEAKGNVKKIYNYGSKGLDAVQLAVLKEPVEGFNYLVFYPPSNMTFGFRRWTDAHNFAKLRSLYMRKMNRLLR